jgi:hypothetical protein
VGVVAGLRLMLAVIGWALLVVALMSFLSRFFGTSAAAQEAPDQDQESDHTPLHPLHPPGACCRLFGVGFRWSFKVDVNFFFQRIPPFWI